MLHEYQRKLDSVETIETNTYDEDDAQPDEEETTMAKRVGGDVPTPMPMPFVPTIF